MAYNPYLPYTSMQGSGMGSAYDYQQTIKQDDQAAYKPRMEALAYNQAVRDTPPDPRDRQGVALWNKTHGPRGPESGNYGGTGTSIGGGSSTGGGGFPSIGGGGGSNDPSSIFRSKLQDMSTGAGNFSTNDPSYNWRFQQGEQALERSQGARGLLNSGTAATELVNYGQGAASQEYGAQFSRMLQGMQGVESAYSQQSDRLMQLAGVNIKQEEVDLSRQRVANDYALGKQTNAASIMANWF